MQKEKPDVKTVTIRLPKSLWKAIRRLEEDGVVRSMQDACVKGLVLLCNPKKKEGN